MKSERTAERYNAVTQRLMNEDAMQAARDQQARQAKINRSVAVRTLGFFFNILFVQNMSLELYRYIIVKVN